MYQPLHHRDWVCVPAPPSADCRFEPYWQPQSLRSLAATPPCRALGLLLPGYAPGFDKAWPPLLRPSGTLDASDDAVGAATVLDDLLQISSQKTGCLDNLGTFGGIK